MTSLDVPVERLPSHTKYLTTVCPSDGHLDYNVHYKLAESKVNEYSIDWPVAEHKRKARLYLTETYLNVARPSMNDIRNESITYVSLPLHITSIFDRVINERLKSKDGVMHIGANVNALRQDPFKSVHLNPGCLSSFVEPDCDLTRGGGIPRNASKSTFNNFTNSFNKFLKIGGPNESGGVSTLPGFSNVLENKNVATSCSIFDRVLDFNSDTYFGEIQSTEASSILVSVHVNVLNVFVVESDSQFKFTKEVTTDKSSIPYEEENKKESYKKIIEAPILRMTLRQNVVATSLRTFRTANNHAVAVIGFDSGEVLIVDLTSLKYKIFDDMCAQNSNIETSSILLNSHSSMFNNMAVTSIELMKNQKYECLLVVGHANGEVVIYNPFVETDQERSKSRYIRNVVASDTYVTYFKHFDLSSVEDDSYTSKTDTNLHIVGHFKLSNKPITSIKSTSPYSYSSASNQLLPCIIAIASDDGFVRFIDLSITHPQIHRKSIITDIISNYFNDGIIDIEFSPDYKFICVVGKGDLIEVFKMTYYNINGLLQKSSNSNFPSNVNINSMSRRSRSGTLNSGNSSNHNNTFLSPRQSSEFHPENGVSEIYPAVIKDIKIVSRFKGHANTVNRVRFLSDNFTSGQGTRSNSLVYKLVSCGFDGKVIVWELDYKALPKTKASKPVRPKKSQSNSSKKHNSLIQTKSPTPIAKHQTSHGMSMITSHGRNKSLSNEEINNKGLTMSSPFNNINSTIDSTNSMINMAALLTPMTKNNVVTNHNMDNQQEHRKIVLSLYQSIYDLRIKKLSNELGEFMSAIIHPIVEDKFIPSISTPVVSIDLSHLIRDGKIDGVYIDCDTFWCFGKNGDIFKFLIEYS